MLRRCRSNISTPTRVDRTTNAVAQRIAGGHNKQVLHRPSPQSSSHPVCNGTAQTGSRNKSGPTSMLTKNTSLACYADTLSIASEFQSMSHDLSPAAVDIFHPMDQALEGIGDWSASMRWNVAEIPSRIFLESCLPSKATGARLTIVKDQKQRIGDEQLPKMPSYLKTVMGLDSLFKS